MVLNPRHPDCNIFHRAIVNILSVNNRRVLGGGSVPIKIAMRLSDVQIHSDQRERWGIKA